MSSKNVEKKVLPVIANAAKVQDGLSFKDKLRLSMAKAQKNDDVKTDNKKTQTPTPDADPSASKTEEPCTKDISLPAEKDANPEKNNATKVETPMKPEPSPLSYEKYVEASDDVCFLDHAEEALQMPDEIPSSSSSADVHFSFELPQSQTDFHFGRLANATEPVHTLENQAVKPVETRPHSDQTFGQAWLNSLPERFSFSSDSGSNPRASSGPEGVPIPQPRADQGIAAVNHLGHAARKDPQLNRRMNPYPRRSQRDFFGHMMPPGYPPVPPAYDFHSQFQVPYPHNGMPNPNQPSVPQAFPTPYFMNAFQPPARPDNSNSADMYGVPPNCMNFGAHYPMNYGAH